LNEQIKKHWNNVYDSKEINVLGWYEERFIPSLKLLNKCNINKDEPVLDVGSGASTFIDSLIDERFTNIIVVDISEIVLNKLKKRLGKEKASLVNWIVDDITNPECINKLKDIALWHDRALLHFLVKEEQRQTYFSTLKNIVKKGGYVIIAAFSLEGARKCSGLDVKNYDSKMLEEDLGEEFRLIQAFNYDYHMPSGDIRPYIYTLFKREML